MRYWKFPSWNPIGKGGLGAEPPNLVSFREFIQVYTCDHWYKAEVKCYEKVIAKTSQLSYREYITEIGFSHFS